MSHARHAPTCPVVRLSERGARSASRLIESEWLLADGFGGFASSSVAGITTRREHGFFVPSLREPGGRHVMISRVEITAPDADPQPFFGGYETQSEDLVSATSRHLRDFLLEHHAPVWRFGIAGRTLEQRVVSPHQQSTSLLELELLEGEAIRLTLRPWLGLRRIDERLANGDGVEDYEDRPEGYGRRIRHRPSGASCVFAVLATECEYVEDRVVLNDVLYRTERDRGYEHIGSQSSPGEYTVLLAPRGKITFTATTVPLDELDLLEPAARDAHRHRVERLITKATSAARLSPAHHLVTAADQFIIVPDARRDAQRLARAGGSGVRSVIAGYHWFGDWGRDTMIALPGLALATGRSYEAGEILRTFATYVRDGLLPNMFPEGERDGRYDTADATLWYFHAIDCYCRAANDLQIVDELFEVLASIIDHHLEGTHFGIGVDASDGLLRAGADGYALTWMDAKFEGRAITPRRGKPVELQALWYNALCLMAHWARESGRDRNDFADHAARARRTFNVRFWNEHRRCLLDVVDGEDGDDESCRPNQIFAISLPHPILDESAWQPVLECVERELLTPFGLRTLSRDHPDYRPTYEGDLATRDAAYHQGTVWPWLIGAFIDAWLRVHGSRERAFAMLRRFEDHLGDAGIGSVSEIFDAEPPHAARGCIAQAWSVAELLRAWLATYPQSGAPPR